MNKWGMLLLVTMLAACSNSQDANKSNFENAINQYYKNNNLCLVLAPIEKHNNPKAMVDGIVGHYGDTKLSIVAKNADGDKVNEQALKQMAVLVNEGIYQEEEREKKAGNGKKEWQIAVFSLTEKGVGYFQGSPLGPKLCVGKQKVEKVNWFTEPTTADGMIVSQVVYEHSYKLDKFAKKLIDQGQYNLEAEINKGKQNRTLLVLTNEGWKDHRLLQVTSQ